MEKIIHRSPFKGEEGPKRDLRLSFKIVLSIELLIYKFEREQRRDTQYMCEV
jgi:hypothetical protein